MDNAVREANDDADRQYEEHSQQAEVIVVQAVEDRHRQDHGGEGKDSFDRQVDRPHQYDESFAEAEHERNRGVLADPDEVSEAKKIVVDDGDDEAQKDEHHRRRPSGYAQAAPFRSRVRDGRTFQRRTHRVAFANSDRLRKVAGAETEGTRLSRWLASCIESARLRGPKCRSNRVWAPP